MIFIKILIQIIIFEVDDSTKVKTLSFFVFFHMDDRKRKCIENAIKAVATINSNEHISFHIYIEYDHNCTFSVLLSLIS